MPLVLLRKICCTIKLKLHSLFAAWLFWPFHNKSNKMKALVILSHSWSPFSHLLVYMEKINLCESLCGLLEYFFENKTPPRLLPNHMTVTTSVHIWSWPDYCKTKENVNIKMLDLCLFTFYSVHAKEFTWHWL